MIVIKIMINTSQKENEWGSVGLVNDIMAPSIHKHRSMDYAT